MTVPSRGGIGIGAAAALAALLAASPALAGPAAKSGKAPHARAVPAAGKSEPATVPGPQATPPPAESGPPAVSCAFQRGTCGFVGADGRVLIQPEFDWAEPFEADLARVKVAGRYGVVDRFGRFVVPPVWGHLSRFVDGIAMVEADGRFGAVDREGREVLAAGYAAAYPLGRGAFLVDAGPADAALDAGRLEYEEDRPPPARVLPGRWTLVGTAQDRPPRFREIRAFGEGNPAGPFWGRPGHKWQLVSGRGTLLTGAVYDQVETATGGVAVVRVGNQWNAIDADGRTLLPPDASAVRRRPDGLVSYQSEDRVGLVGRNGAVAVPAAFDRIGTFVGDRAPASRQGLELWIDGGGNAVSPPSEPAPSTAPAARPRGVVARGRVMACPDGLTLKAGAGDWSFVDRKWHPAIRGVFESARCFVRGTALVVLPGSGRWSRIDRNGAAVSGPAFCRLPDYAADAAGTVGRQPACRPAETADAAAGGRVSGGGP